MNWNHKIKIMPIGLGAKTQLKSIVNTRSYWHNNK